MSKLIQINGLSKSFGPIKAVKNVSFEVDKGEVLGFLGPNGAGKSTTMKMITCYLTPTSGTASVCGHSILDNPLQVRKEIGYLPEGAPAYGDMTTAGFLKFIAEVRGFSGAEKKKRIDRVVEQVGLQGVLGQSIETLSKGFKRRVGLAQSILHDPKVLIMDEPTDGLDPNQKFEVRKLIKQMSEDKVIILSTHILEEVESVCNRSIIIAKGTKIFDGTPDELLAKSERHHMVVMTVDKDSVDKALHTIRELDDVKIAKRATKFPNGNQNIEITPKNSANLIGPLTQLCRDQHWRIYEMRLETGRMDEVFRTLTMDASGGKAA